MLQDTADADTPLRGMVSGRVGVEGSVTGRGKKGKAGEWAWEERRGR